MNNSGEEDAPPAYDESVVGGTVRVEMHDTNKRNETGDVGSGEGVQGDGIGNTDGDLSTFFDKNGLPDSLKKYLIARGTTLDKLLVMTEDQILLYAKMNPEMMADVILLIGALKDYKESMNGNNKTSLVHGGYNEMKNDFSPEATPSAPPAPSSVVLKNEGKKDEASNGKKEEKKRNDLQKVFDYIKQNCEKEFYAIAFILMGITIYTIIFPSFYDYTMKCDENCVTAYDDDYQCQCYSYDDESQVCGYNSEGSESYCSQEYGSIGISMIVIAFGIDIILMTRFIAVKLKYDPIRSFLVALYAIIMIACFIIPLFLVLYGWIWAGFWAPFVGLKQYLQRKRKKENNNDRNDTKTNTTTTTMGYDTKDNYFDLMTAAMTNGDIKFYIFWILFAGWTWTSCVFLGVKTYEYKFYCDLGIDGTPIVYDSGSSGTGSGTGSDTSDSVDSYVCMDFRDVNQLCGYDSDGNDVYCQSDEKYIMYESGIIAVIVLNVFFLMCGIKYICKKSFGQALMMALSLQFVLCTMSVAGFAFALLCAFLCII